MGATETSGSRAIDAEQFAAPATAAPSPALAPPPGSPRFPLFDGLRGIAVLGILAFHVTEFTSQIGFGLGGRFAEVAGGEAVITFFVISGFLLYRPYVAARAAAKPVLNSARYLRRRALRILPAYWVALTVLAIYPGVHSIFSADWWRYYGYSQLYSQRTLGGGIPVAWTLCVEVTFYLALPVWAFGVRRIGGGARGTQLLRAELIPLALVALGGIAVQMLVATHRLSNLVGSSILGQCTWMCVGMAFAVLSVVAFEDESVARRIRPLSERPGLCWLGVLVAGAGLLALVPRGGLFGLIAAVETGQPPGTMLAKLVLQGIFVVLLVLPAVLNGSRPGVPRRILAFRPFVLLGVISYSFYLYHLVVVQMLALSRDTKIYQASSLDLLKHVHVARSWTLYIAALGVTAVIATLSYRFVELPFLRMKEGGHHGQGGKRRLSILRPR